MAKQDLNELVRKSALADGPSFCPSVNVRLGGVDPLGMRQINFDLMDRVLPNLNNVARHIRPLVVIAWAWRRARQVAEKSGQASVDVNSLEDFVDRIDVLYVWSQFLIAGNVDLPGRQVLQPLFEVDRYEFGGDEWAKRREARRDSTALSAALNYGPLAKSMGWILPHEDQPGVFVANPVFENALDDFQAQFTQYLDLPVFSRFGPVEISSEAVQELGVAWALENLTDSERKAAKRAMKGEPAPTARKHGIELMEAACAFGETSDSQSIRRLMAGCVPKFQQEGSLGLTQEAWRNVQVRQAFRLAMEALFYWVVRKLDGQTQPVDRIVSSFISDLPDDISGLRAEEWLRASFEAKVCPVDIVDEIRGALEGGELNTLPSMLVSALSYCLLKSPAEADETQRPERLPLWRAQAEYIQHKDDTARDFLRYILEVWMLGQHTFWAIGRGLTDARSRGKLILRLKIVIEEEGWALVPGASSLAPPNPTPDRLDSALSFAVEYGLEEQ